MKGAFSSSSTLVRQDEIKIPDTNVTEVYNLSLEWLNKKSFNIVKKDVSRLIIAKQRIPSMGDDTEVDSWYKDIEISISQIESNVKIVIKLYSPWKLNKNKLHEAKIVFGEHIEELYRFLGIKITDEIFRQIHSREYVDYKLNKANYLTIFLVVMDVVIVNELRIFFNLTNSPLLMLVLLCDVMLLYKIIMFSRRQILQNLPID